MVQNQMIANDLQLWAGNNQTKTSLSHFDRTELGILDGAAPTRAFTVLHDSALDAFIQDLLHLLGIQSQGEATVLDKDVKVCVDGEGTKE